MTDDDRVMLPEKITGDWADRQAARILLYAEIDLGNGDRVANCTSLAEAWRDLAASMRGEF